MHCFRIMSIFVAIFLFLSLAACLVGIWSISWWTGDFEAPIPGSKDNIIPVNYTMHWLFAVRYGLWKVCWWSKHAALTSDPDGYQIVPPLKHCSKHEISVEYIMKDPYEFRNILICLVIGAIFNVLAFSSAFFNLPCIRRLKRCLVFVTIILIIIAAIAVLVGLFIANNSLHYDALFMENMRAKGVGEVFGSTNSSIQHLLMTVSTKIQSTNLSDAFEKGYSFVVTCIAEVFLLLALIFAIIENCCFQRRPEREYHLDEKKPLKM